MENLLSIVVPVYNSRDSLPVLCEQLFKTLQGDDIEIILVDDGSKSPTWGMIQSIKVQYGDKIKGIRLSKNFGQHNATVCGLSHCTKNYVVTIDDDLQFKPAEIPVLLKKLIDESLDIVYGLPLEKRQSMMRVLGLYFVYLLSVLFGEGIVKSSGFRVMKKELAHQLQTNRRYYLNLDLIITWYTGRIGFCMVEHHKRTTHQSGYSNMGLISIIVRAIIAYSAVPYKLFRFLFICSALLGIYVLACYLFFGTLVHCLLPFVAIFIPVFLLGFTMLFAYLYHIINFISNRPCYQIAEEAV